MKALVVGGSGSGKSAFAEDLACSLSPTRTYLATMESASPEAQSRIARHRRQRQGRGFTTIECPRSLAMQACATETGSVALLEDLGNLAANALFAYDGSMADPSTTLDRLEREVIALADHYDHVVVVGNEVGSEGISPYPATLTWIQLVGELCCRLAARFDLVIEVTAGIPLVVKGTRA